VTDAHQSNTRGIQEGRTGLEMMKMSPFVSMWLFCAGIEVIFFLVACTLLCFGIVTKTEMMTQGFYSYG